MPNVIDNEDIYNVITLNGTSSPGVVTLSGHDRKIDWDVRMGPFQSGATTAFKAIPPIEFSATFYLVKDVAQGLDDFAAWPAFQKLCFSTISNPRSPSALTIYHPDLAANAITSVVLASMGGMIYDGKGGAHITVKFQEYRPYRKMDGTVQTKPAVETNADLKAVVRTLTTQYTNTPSG